MSKLNIWAMLVPTTRAVSGAGIFLKTKMVLLKKGHKNRMISVGIETYSASIFALFIVSDKLIITSFIFFFTSSPTKAFSCVSITITPIPHMNPATTG